MPVSARRCPPPRSPVPALTVAAAQRLEEQLPPHADGRHGGTRPAPRLRARSPQRCRLPGRREGRGGGVGNKGMSSLIASSACLGGGEGRRVCVLRVINTALGAATV